VTMSARKAKRRVMDMMASTVMVSFRWMAADPESAALMRRIQSNTGRVMNALKQAVKEAEQCRR